jgi:hypothetical protein
MLAGVVAAGILCLAAQAHADPRADVAAKAKAAMASYDSMDYEVARKQLYQALALAKKAKLDKEPIVARVYVDLAITQLAGSDQDAARLSLLTAAQIDPKITVDAAYKSPELVKLLDEAKAIAAGIDDRGLPPGDSAAEGRRGLIDLARDTVIVTADHGHVRPGGHGGREAEVSNVPLVLAGSGIIAGATARDARLIDVAPTVAALLGVPAPGCAEGRALVELLRLSPDEAARRAAADASRSQAVLATAAAARAEVATPSPIRLAVLAIGVAAAVALAIVLVRRRALVIAPRSLAGAIGFVAMLIAAVALTRGQLSPSYVPSQARTLEIGGLAVVAAVALQVMISGWSLRRAHDRLAAASGAALVGLTVALAAVATARAWFSPPHLAVPPPLWLVAVPALDVAAATCAFAALVTLALAARPSPGRAEPDGARRRRGTAEQRSEERTERNIQGAALKGTAPTAAGA